MRTEDKRNIIGLILLILIFVAALMVERSCINYEQRNEKHFERFEQMMRDNNYEYSDAMCKYVWELTK